MTGIAANQPSDKAPAGRESVRASYDRVAGEYARRIAGELEHKPFDRALLDEIAERTRGQGRVVDVGCGPGHVTAYLHARGVDVEGVDLSPVMIEEARERFPGVAFRVGDVTALEAEDGAWGAAVAFYSLIHLPRGDLPVALRELRRVLRPDGRLVIAFHVGEEVRHFDELWGAPVDLDFVFFTVGQMRRELEAAGFAIERCTTREPYPDVEAQTTRC